MGWGRTLLLGDVGNQLDIQDIGESVQRIKETFRKVAEVDNNQGRDIQHLIEENHELKLYLGTLVRLLIAKNILSEEETRAIVEGIENNQ